QRFLTPRRYNQDASSMGIAISGSTYQACQIVSGEGRGRVCALATIGKNGAIAPNEMMTERRVCLVIAVAVSLRRQPWSTPAAIDRRSHRRKVKKRPVQRARRMISSFPPHR